MTVSVIPNLHVIFQKPTVLTTILINQRCLGSFGIGVSPHKYYLFIHLISPLTSIFLETKLVTYLFSIEKVSHHIPCQTRIVSGNHLPLKLHQQPLWRTMAINAAPADSHKHLSHTERKTVEQTLRLSKGKELSELPVGNLIKIYFSTYCKIVTCLLCQSGKDEDWKKLALN